MNSFFIKATVAMTFAASITAMATDKKDFNYVVDRFADIEVLRYQVPGFENLPLQQKKLIYYLTEAALSGRDILWDQNNKYNLQLRSLLENIYKNYSGDKNSSEFKAFEKYLKQVEFGNGVHHHYSMDKFTPEFSRAFSTLRWQHSPLTRDRQKLKFSLKWSLIQPSWQKKSIRLRVRI